MICINMDTEFLNEDDEIKWMDIHGISPGNVQDKCSYCGKRQYRIAFPPKEVEIEIWPFTIECYSCHSTTPVVWVSAEGYNFFESIDPNSFKDLEIKLSEIYPSFKKVFKKLKDIEQYGNTCVNCGIYQGDFFVFEEYLEYVYTPELINKKVVKVTLTEDERLYYASNKKVETMHRPKNSKYKLLCDDCYKLYKDKINKGLNL